MEFLDINGLEKLVDLIRENFAAIDHNHSGTYVESLGTSGNYVTWKKGTSTNNLTVPYATKAGSVTNLSNSLTINTFTNSDAASPNTSTTFNGSSAKTASVADKLHVHSLDEIRGTSSNIARVVCIRGGSPYDLTTSNITTTKLNYLSGVTSDIQTQLNGKASSNHTHNPGDIIGGSSSYYEKLAYYENNGVLSYANDNNLKSCFSSIKVAYYNVAQTWSAYQIFSAGAGESSDIRFKESVKKVDNILDDINKIDVIEYTWNHPNEEGTNHTFGVSADQVEEIGGICTLMVHEADDEYKTKSVQYDRFGVLAIKGLQEVNEKLEKKCAKLENALKLIGDKLGLNIEELLKEED